MALKIKTALILILFLFSYRSFAALDSFTIEKESCRVEVFKNKKWDPVRTELKKGRSLKGKVLENKPDFIFFKLKQKVYRIEKTCTESVASTPPASETKKEKTFSKNQSTFGLALGLLFWQEQTTLLYEKKSTTYLINQKAVCPGFTYRHPLSQHFSWGTDLCVFITHGYLAPHQKYSQSATSTHSSYLNSTGIRGELGLFWHPESFDQSHFGLQIPISISKVLVAPLPEGHTLDTGIHFAPGFLLNASLVRDRFSVTPVFGTTNLFDDLIFGIRLSWRL